MLPLRQQLSLCRHRVDCTVATDARLVLFTAAAAATVPLFLLSLLRVLWCIFLYVSSFYSSWLQRLQRHAECFYSGHEPDARLLSELEAALRQRAEKHVPRAGHKARRALDHGAGLAPRAVDENHCVRRLLLLRLLRLRLPLFG
jgi:hypothetical protein